MIGPIAKHVIRMDGLALLEKHFEGDDDGIRAARAKMVSRDFCTDGAASVFGTVAEHFANLPPIALREQLKHQLEAIPLKAQDTYMSQSLTSLGPI